MNQLQENNQLTCFVKRFRNLLMLSVILLTLSFVCWVYLSLKTWLAVMLAGTFVILAIWLFFIHPLYYAYIVTKLNKQFYNENLQEINNRILSLNLFINELFNTINEKCVFDNSNSKKLFDLKINQKSLS